MVVQHNMQAANTNRQLGITTGLQAKSTEKLASGFRVNRAADDAAGLAISEKIRSQVRGLDRASTNAQDGISVVQTAEGALNEVHSILQRMNELATQAANDTNTSMDRSQIQLEINQLGSEIDRIASTTQFNTMDLLDGSFTSKNLQVGSLEGQKIEISISKMKASGLGLGVAGASLKVSSFSKAGASMTLIQNAIDKVSTQRARLGAVQNRLEHTIANLEHLPRILRQQSPESAIRIWRRKWSPTRRTTFSHRQASQCSHRRTSPHRVFFHSFSKQGSIA